MGMLLGARRKRPDPPLHSADVRFNIPVPPVKIHTRPIKDADQPLDIINVQPNFTSARRIIEVLRQKVDDAVFLTRRLCANTATTTLIAREFKSKDSMIGDLKPGAEVLSASFLSPPTCMRAHARWPCYQVCYIYLMNRLMRCRTPHLLQGNC